MKKWDYISNKQVIVIMVIIISVIIVHFIIK